MKRVLVVLLAACADPGPAPQTCGLSGTCEAAERLATSWTLVSRGFEFGCGAFVEPRVEITIGDDVHETDCSDAVLVANVSADRYTIRGAMVSGGEEFRTATTQVTVRGSTSAELEFRFDDFALGGEFADSLGSALCARCAPSDPLGCGDRLRAWACGDAGTCDLPTWGLTSELSRCRADLQVMACDGDTLPQSCAAFTQVLPGLVR